MFYYKFYIELPIENFPSTIFYSAFDNALKAADGEELCGRLAKDYVDEYKSEILECCDTDDESIVGELFKMLYEETSCTYESCAKSEYDQYRKSLS